METRSSHYAQGDKHSEYQDSDVELSIDVVDLLHFSERAPASIRSDC